MNNPWKSLALPALLVIDYVFLCHYAWRAWHTFSMRFPDRKFYFRITDIWASMIGLTPSFVLAAHAFNHSAREIEVLALLLLLPAQIVWMFKGRLLAQETERLTGGYNPLESAAMILGAAVWAIPFALMCALALTTCFPAFVIYAALYTRPGAPNILDERELRKLAIRARR